MRIGTNWSPLLAPAGANQASTLQAKPKRAWPERIRWEE